jgi:hypothetical protein
MTSCAYPGIHIVATNEPTTQSITDFLSTNATLLSLLATVLVATILLYYATTWAQRSIIVVAALLTCYLIFPTNAPIPGCSNTPSHVRVTDTAFETHLHSENGMPSVFVNPTAIIEPDATITLDNHSVRCVGGCDAFTITDNATTFTVDEPMDEWVGMQPCFANHTIYVSGPNSDAELPTCAPP